MILFDSRRKRLQAVVSQVAATRIASNLGSSDARRREAIQAKLKEVERQYANRNKFDLGRAIAHAGLRITRQQFVLAAAVAGFCFALVGLMLSPFAAILAGLIGFLGIPRVFLNLLTKRRVSQFTSRFAEALDIIIRSVRSGLPLGESLHIIGREMPDPIGQEFRMVTEGIRLGMTIDEGLTRLSDRMPTTEVRFFSIVAGIQQQTGGNLSETLSKLSEILRARKRMRDKIQAMSSEAKTSAIIIGSLPIAVAGMLALIAHEYIMVLFTTTPGHVILFGAGCVMAAGTMVMRAMINFDI